MTEDQWMEAVRRRTHDIANRVTINSELVTVLRERQAHIANRLEQLETLRATVSRLESQASILRWILATLTALTVGIAIRLV